MKSKTHCSFLSLSSFLLLALFFGNIESSCFAQTSSASTVPTFASRLFDRTSLQLILMGAGGSALLQKEDENIRKQWYQHQKMDEKTADVGDFLGTGIPGGLIAISQSIWDKENAPSHWRALIATFFATYALKETFHRQRPGGSENRQSYPSGHTSTTFATATHLSYAYGWKAAAVAYPLAIFTGLTRMSDDAHYASDVLGGAFVGIWMGRASFFYTNTFNQPSDKPSEMKSEKIKNDHENILWYPEWTSRKKEIRLTFLTAF